MSVYRHMIGSQFRSDQAESNRHHTHPKGTDYHYPMVRLRLEASADKSVRCRFCFKQRAQSKIRPGLPGRRAYCKFGYLRTLGVGLYLPRKRLRLPPILDVLPQMVHAFIVLFTLAHFSALIKMRYFELRNSQNTTPSHAFRNSKPHDYF